MTMTSQDVDDFLPPMGACRLYMIDDYPADTHEPSDLTRSLMTVLPHPITQDPAKFLIHGTSLYMHMLMERNQQSSFCIKIT